jgi:hypothetical protein
VTAVLTRTVTTAAAVLTRPEARIFVQLDEWASGGTIAASVDTPSSSRHPHDRGVESGVIRHGAGAQARDRRRRRFPRGRCMTHCVRFGRSAGRDPGARFTAVRGGWVCNIRCGYNILYSYKGENHKNILKL